MEIEKLARDAGVLLRPRGTVGPDDIARLREVWDAQIEQLLDDGDVAIVVDLAQLAAGAAAADVLAGWIVALGEMDGFYRLAGASPALRDALAATGAGPGSLFDTEAAAWTGADGPIWLDRPDAFATGGLWVHADGAHAEGAALLDFLAGHRAGFSALELRIGRETFEPPDFVWKLFDGRLWPVTVADGAAAATYTPREEHADDEDQHNYHLWDSIAPRLADRPFVVGDRRILVGFNAAIAALLGTGRS